MESLVKSTTLRFSRRADCYEPLDQIRTTEGNEPYIGGGEDDERGWRTFSRKLRSRRHGGAAAVAWSSLSYRRERARRRQVFLRGYKLETSSAPAKARSEKLRKLVVRAMKSALVSFASLTRRISSNNCNSKSAIRVVSPAQVIKCC